MSKSVDLTGMIFGRLIVLKEGEPDYSKKGEKIKKWVCQCSCHGENSLITVRHGNLTSGNTTSCGCYAKEASSKRKIKDLTNMKFGRLTVLNIDSRKYFKSGHNTIIWKCICDCQLDKPEEERKYTYVTSNNLLSGDTKSCGCLQKERASLANKKPCLYDLITEEYGIGYTSNGDEFWFDKEDYDLIKDYGWNKRYDGYFVAHNGNSIIRLSRLIMQVKDPNIIVDHKEHNLWDNRKEKMRLTNKKGNARNHKLFSNNTSGHTGVSWHKQMNKWVARIVVNYNEIILGYFDKKEDAVRVRKEAEEKYFGEWSYENSMKDSEEAA